MGTVTPIRPGIQPLLPIFPTIHIHPAGQASSSDSGPSAWAILAVVAVGIVVYEGVKYVLHNQPDAAPRRRSYR